MRSLLDVNVLIALLDEAHIHHAVAHRWLERELHQGWASCPITQNGCIRIMSQPAYPGALQTAEVVGRLTEAASGAHHAFWPDDVNFLADKAIQWSRVLGHRQLTDVYLLALAVRHGGRFVTLDQRISFGAVEGGRAKQLVVIS